METTHEHTHGHAHEHGHSHEHAHDEHTEHHEHGHHDENWNDEEFVERWMGRQKERETERRRQFIVMRALIPKTTDQEFRYLNLGAGPGNLDEVLLEHFKGANAVLLDVSLPLLGAARQRLQRFGNRAEYVQANLDNPDWTGAVGGTFDFVVSSFTIHHLREAGPIRELYAQVHRLLGHGGMFLNLEYVRPPRPGLADLAQWAAKDPEAGLNAGRGGFTMPGTLMEQLGWLGEAGFANVDVPWKDMNTALLLGLRDHLHLPDGHAHEAGHAH